VCRGVLAMSSRARNEWICIAVAHAVQRVRSAGATSWCLRYLEQGPFNVWSLSGEPHWPSFEPLMDMVARVFQPPSQRLLP
jgi:hypothetical protein